MSLLKKMEFLTLRVTNNALLYLNKNEKREVYQGASLFQSDESAAQYLDNLLPSSPRQKKYSKYLKPVKNFLILFLLLVCGITTFAFIPLNNSKSLDRSLTSPITKVNAENLSASKKVIVIENTPPIEEEWDSYSDLIVENQGVNDYYQDSEFSYDYNEEKVVIQIQPK